MAPRGAPYRDGYNQLTRLAKFDSYHAQVAKQLMLPIEIDGNTIVVSPSERSAMLCVRHIRQVVDVNSVTYPDGFSVIMSPDLFQPGFISGSVPSFVPAAGAGMINIKGEMAPREDSQDAQLGRPLSVVTGEEHAIFSLQPVADSALAVRNAITFAPQAVAQNYNLYWTSEATLAPCVVEWSSKLAGGAWGAWTQVKIAAKMQASSTVLMAIGADAIAFRFSADTDKKVVTQFSLISQLGQVACAAANTFGPAFARFALDNNIQQCRVISMSLLATNTSSDMYNGGDINVGNVTRAFNPFADVAAQISKLPENRRYQGRAATGGYCFWNPDQLDEFVPDNLPKKLEQLIDSTYLFTKVSGWGGAAGGVSSFKLQFDWVVEFYTDNQLYEKIQTPDMSPQFSAMYHLIASMDRCTCNPGHADLLREYFRKAVSAARGAHQWYSDHSSTIDPIAKLILSALA